ncbi:MAG: 30S ribosome-binding factor RbfA [Phycisphaerales bacterium]|nr:30S ribosome-binding factor RbfA [Phycisphaerales bacterium]
MSHRVEKIESTLARAVQEVLRRGLHDPRARGLISVTRVDVSPDLHNAIVFVSVLPEEHQDLTMHALKHAARHIRREAGELMAIRRLPELDFRLDLSLKKQAEVFEVLSKVEQERKAVEGSEIAGGPEGAPPGGAEGPR